MNSPPSKPQDLIERLLHRPPEEIVSGARSSISGIRIRQQLEYESVRAFFEKSKERYWGAVVNMPETVVQKNSWRVPNRVMDDANIAILLDQGQAGVEAFREKILGNRDIGLTKIGDDSTERTVHVAYPISPDYISVNDTYHPLLGAREGDLIKINQGYYFGGNTLVVLNHENFENRTLRSYMKEVGIILPDLFNSDND